MPLHNNVKLRATLARLRTLRSQFPDAESFARELNIPGSTLRSWIATGRVSRAGIEFLRNALRRLSKALKDANNDRI